MEPITNFTDTHSIFKDGKSDTTTEAYTEAWIRLINLVEQNRRG